MKIITWLCLVLAGVLSLSAVAQERRMILSGKPCHLPMKAGG